MRLDSVLVIVLCFFAACVYAQTEWAPYSPDVKPSIWEPPVELLRQKRGIATPFAFVYLNPTPQAMKDALDYTANTILGSVIDFTVQLRIQVNYTDLGSGVLGFAGPASSCSDSVGNVSIWAYAPLRDTQAGSHVCKPSTSYEIGAYFSDLTSVTQTVWDFNTDGAAAIAKNATDFVSVALHELLHGLGFVTEFWKFTNNSIMLHYNRPGVYDLHLTSGQSASNLLYTKSDPSADLISGDIWFYPNDSLSPDFIQLYAPNPWSASSLGHYIGDNTTNTVMKRATTAGTRTRNVGPYVLRMLRTLGYNLTAAALSTLPTTAAATTTASATTTQAGTTTPASSTSTAASTTTQAGTTPSGSTTTPATSTTTPSSSTTTQSPGGSSDACAQRSLMKMWIACVIAITFTL